LIAEKAKERQYEGKNQYSPVQISAQAGGTGKTRDELAKLANVSHDS